MRSFLPAVRTRSQPAATPVSASSSLSAHESRGSRELRELLHRRLRNLSTIALVLLGGLFVFGVRVMPRAQLVGVMALFATVSVPAAILRFQRDLSMAALRRLDLGLLLIGFLMAFLSCLGRIIHAQSVPIPPEQAFHMSTVRGVWYVFSDGSIYIKHGTTAACSHIVLNWGLFAIGYSVAIPNTWRRAALIMAAIVSGALGCVVLDAHLNPGLRQVLPASLFNTFYLVAVFAAIGLYGSHKLEALRSQVSEARQVGQYALKAVLGRGGMGEVYLAQHRLLRRPCAVKLIRPEQAGNASNLARFEREVQAMAQLTHPNIVEIYDYGRTDDGMFYYAMEYLPGLTAEELCRRHGPLSPGRAIHLLTQVCGALGEAHETGLIHRDIKPGNLFVCERGRIHDVVKLLDFGLVQVGAEPEPPPPGAAPEPAAVESSDVRLTQAGHILGTPAYMSPEQSRGDLADSRSDIYSVGAVAYFLLTGRPPFLRPTVAGMVEAHQSEPPPPLPAPAPGGESDPALAGVVLRCLEKDPARRYQSARELRLALLACPSAAGWDSDQAARWWRERQPGAPPAAAAESSTTVDQTLDVGSG